MNSVRGILFKGKRIDNGKWVEGFYLYNPYSRSSKHIIISVEDGILAYAVDPDTVCQYIGLNDKNDNRIFEGDIVNIEYTETTVVKAVITYIGASFYGNRYDDCWELDGYTSLEVIGNIFDNPEIVEE